MASATIVFHRLALREYEAARRWYRRRGIRASDRFQDALEAAVERIAAAPDRWPTFGQNHRWVRTGRFPYVLYYRVVAPALVIVVAVAHSRRRLGYWAKRAWP